MSDSDLVAGGSVSMSNFEAHLTDAKHAGRLLIDLRDATFIEAYGIVGVACMAKAAKKTGRQVIVRPPTNASVANYLARMDLTEFLDGHCRATCALPKVQHADRGDVLVELTWFDDWQNLDPLVGLLYDRLHTATRTRGPSLDALLESVYEIADNVRYHSNADGGVMAAQVYSRGRRTERVTVAVGDVGIGICRSLRGSGRYDPHDDLDAIRLALREQVSAVDDPGRGVGLPTTLESTLGYGGTMVVRSGTAARHMTPTKTRNVQRGSVRGTIVGVSIPCG